MSSRLGRLRNSCGPSRRVCVCGRRRWGSLPQERPSEWTRTAQPCVPPGGLGVCRLLSVPSPSLLPQGFPLLLRRSSMLESMFVSVLASQCVYKSKTALEARLGNFTWICSHCPPRWSLAAPPAGASSDALSPPCSLCPRSPAHPASPWAARTQLPPPSWLQAHSCLLDLEFSSFWGYV